MKHGPVVRLTSVGWRRLHDELTSLRRRRLEASLAAAGGSRQTSPARAESASPAELQYLEHCISELEWVLGRSEPDPNEDVPPGLVHVGRDVEVVWDDGVRELYRIVAPENVAPRFGHISYVSPVGLALMGRRCGEEVMVIVDDRLSTLRIKAVKAETAAPVK